LLVAEVMLAWSDLFPCCKGPLLLLLLLLAFLFLLLRLFLLLPLSSLLMMLALLLGSFLFPPAMWLRRLTLLLLLLPVAFFSSCSLAFCSALASSLRSASAVIARSPAHSQSDTAELTSSCCSASIRSGWFASHS
jgi:hypothetical protein